MRALRVLFVANDGMSAGHVVRMLALARELARRDVPTARVIATTSRAQALLAMDGAPAVVQLPAPAGARAAGLDDASRRRLVRGTLDGVLGAFAPDVVVVDTFPTGPHGELALAGIAARKVLVRRATKDADAAILAEGVTTFDLGITCEEGAFLPIRTVAVPPITLLEPAETLDRATARARLGLPADGDLFLVTAGGGGDEEALRFARAIAERLPGRSFFADGPLSSVTAPTPLQRYLAAFDGAFAAAGYNTAHELAKARMPTVFFARPRPFDDQASRASRFASHGLALVTDDVDAGLAFLRASRPHAGIPGGGAARAIDAILELVGG